MDKKMCDNCRGKGWKHTGIGIVFYRAIKYLPTFRKCIKCDGTGEVFKTINELNQDKNV